MKRFTIIAVCIIISLIVTVSCALAQLVFQDEVLTIYGGQRAETVGIKLGGWGSGACIEAPTNIGNNLFIEIMGRGLSNGGRLEFKNPLDLTKYFSDPNIYLQLQIKSPYLESLASPESEFGAAVQPGLSETVPSYSMSPLGRPMINPGAFRPITKIQIMLELADGRYLEQTVKLEWFEITGRGWSSISVPLVAFEKNIGAASYQVKRIFIGNDGTEPLDISQVLLVRDTTPLEVNAGEEMILSQNYESSFYASSRHGIGGVKYSWDFDSSDGMQEDAAGIYTFYTYYKEGEYTITVTASDPFGIKKPAVATVNVRVN